MSAYDEVKHAETGPQRQYRLVLRVSIIVRISLKSVDVKGYYCSFAPDSVSTTMQKHNYHM